MLSEDDQFTTDTHVSCTEDEWGPCIQMETFPSPVKQLRYSGGSRRSVKKAPSR